MLCHVPRCRLLSGRSGDYRLSAWLVVVSFSISDVFIVFALWCITGRRPDRLEVCGNRHRPFGGRSGGLKFQLVLGFRPQLVAREYVPSVSCLS
jgi:hypothetical protein